MNRMVECVPNFSEGNDLTVIEKIATAIESVNGIRLLNFDSGKAANRTVMTFAGTPEQVVEAAFRGIKSAAETIDMRKHWGEHPRFGATDVCPLIPLWGVTMEETVILARQLAKRVGAELEIPVYCYEHAAFTEERKSLANCRAGKYEALKQRISSETWKPDFGPTRWSERVAKSGATAIGARNFLIAYNINLNTTSAKIANAIAFDVRESGRYLREGNLLTGKIVTDENGKPVTIPGTLKKTRAIGWYIKEFNCAQVSMNLLDFSITSMHRAFEEVKSKAMQRNVKVTGSELVGLVPLQAMLDSGKYYLQNPEKSFTDEEIITVAVKSLGLDELAPFDPKKKIIEYLMEDNTGN